MLLDTPMRQLAEIAFFEKGDLVTAPSWDILGKLHGTNLFESNLKRMPSVESQKVRSRVVEKISQCAYGVLSRKLAHKDAIEKQFK